MDWRAAVWSGVVAGVVFIAMDMTLVPLFGFGSPWEVVRLIAAIALGPGVLPPPASFDPGVFAVAMAVHFSLSVLYAILRAWAVEGWMNRLPMSLQGAFGIVIYIVNFYGFTRLFPWFVDARSWVSLLVHVSWAIVLPIVYHRLVRPGHAGAEDNALPAFPLENPNPVLETGTDGRIRFANPAAEQLARELGLESPEGLLPARHDVMVQSCAASGQSLRGVEAVVHGRVLSWAYRPDAEAGVVHLYATDVTEQKEAEGALRHAALHDALTGLPNAILLRERVQEFVRHTRHHPDCACAILRLDLDRYGQIVASQGSDAGDRVLTEVAGRLQALLQDEATVARLEGDDFGILLEHVGSLGEVVHDVERIQRAVAEPMRLNGGELVVTASIGVVASSAGYERAEDILRDAGTAMHQAKALGRAHFEIFDPDMRARAVRVMEVESVIRRALDQGEFLLHYQPIVALDTRRAEAFEALLRMRHARPGAPTTGDLIGVAEEADLVAPIGWWAIREACRQLGQWHRALPAASEISVGVNVSVAHLLEEGMVEGVESILRENRIAGRFLKLEITERAILQDAEATLHVLKRLRALGVGVAIDDFGTGYSSLAYLQRLPANTLKIDRSFVSRIEAGARDLEIVRAIVTLAHAVGMDVVAEGVETRGQERRLLSLDCDYGQGDLYSRAVGAEQAAELIGGRM